MEKYVIRGGKPLVGDVNIGGAKNAAVAILPATILAGGKCLIENLPCISDVMASLQILSELGASIRMVSRSTYEIDTSHLDSTEVSNELSRQMRASYYFLGALLGRFGSGQVAMPGGCNLGPRPIDQHLKAFTAFGAEDSVEYGQIHVRSEHLVGGHVFFDTVSVGATMNAMLAAVLAEGTTILENVAREPHIVDLANFLNMMGADVHGAGTDVIKIHGVKEMHGCNYSIIPDQIEAGSYMVAAAITKGDITLHNVIPKHMEPITAKLRAAGCEVEEFDDALRITRTGELKPLKLKTMPHPGFPTDMQPLMTALLTLAKGTSIVTEGIWENRFRYVDELIHMGANIQVDGQVAVIEGVKELHPAPLRATDLRAGAAMVMAALAANGVSEVDETIHIERGYENIVEKLQALGADIRRVEIPANAVSRAIKKDSWAADRAAQFLWKALGQTNGIFYHPVFWLLRQLRADPQRGQVSADRHGQELPHDSDRAENPGSGGQRLRRHPRHARALRPRLGTGYLFEKAPRPAVRMCRYAGYAGLPRHDSARGGGNPCGRSDAGNRQLHGDELSHQP